MNIRNTENTLVLGLFLGVTATIAAFVLAYFSDLTAKPIAEAQARTQAAAIRQVLPDFANNPAEDCVTVKGIDGSEVAFFVARDASGKVVGVAGQGVTPKGYAGKITALVGLFPDGKIRTVLITENNETPGLGSNVCNRVEVKTLKSLLSGKKSEGLPGNPILDAFSGKVAGDTPWLTVKDGGEIPYRTGATVSSRAVTEVTYLVGRTFLLNQKQILANKEAK